MFFVYEAEELEEHGEVVYTGDYRRLVRHLRRHSELMSNETLEFIDEVIQLPLINNTEQQLLRMKKAAELLKLPKNFSDATPTMSSRYRLDSNLILARWVIHRYLCIKREGFVEGDKIILKGYLPDRSSNSSAVPIQAPPYFEIKKITYDFHIKIEATVTPDAFEIDTVGERGIDFKKV